METAFLVTLVVSLSIFSSLLTWNYCRIRTNQIWWEVEEEMKKQRKAFTSAIANLILSKKEVTRELTNRQDGLSDKIDELEKRLDWQHKQIENLTSILESHKKGLLAHEEVLETMRQIATMDVEIHEKFHDKIEKLLERVSDIEAGLEDEVADAILASILGQKKEEKKDTSQDVEEFITRINECIDHVESCGTIEEMEKVVMNYEKAYPQYKDYVIWTDLVNKKRTSFSPLSKEEKKEEPKAEGI